jgi:phosphate transport system substrate-binding protein
MRPSRRANGPAMWGLSAALVALAFIAGVPRGDVKSAEGRADAPVGRADAPAGRARPLVFAGSGSNVSITRLLADAFHHLHPEIAIDVPGSIGSTGGIRAVADGAIAVALISRPVREAERGSGLTVVPYARTAVVIGAHPTVPVTGLTFEDLVQIYRGLQTRWNDGHEIVVLTRESGDSSLEVLERGVPSFQAASNASRQAGRWRTLYTDQEMTRTLGQTSYAIGMLDLGTIVAERAAIKVLEMNGIAPTLENVRTGRYPLAKTLSFAFRRDRLAPTAQTFMDFVRSPAGAKILGTNGYLPEG